MSNKIIKKLVSFVKYLFTITVYGLVALIWLIICGAGIWISLFALGWFLAMIGIL